MGIIEDNKIPADELIRYSRLCYERHLVGAAGGNLSVRISDKDIFLATASGISLRDVTLDNIVAVDSNGNIIDGQVGLKPSKEISFHLAIYNAKPDVNAVIHVHPTFVTVYTIAKKQIPLVTVSAKLKLRQSQIVSEADPGSKELCNNIIEMLSNSSPDTTVLLLERHGLVAYHKTLCNAFNDTELAEDTAKIAFFVSRFNIFESPEQIVDLTASLNERIQCYPTDPAFKKSWHVEFKNAGVFVSKIEMGTHTGTHVDVPLHFIEDGVDISMMPTEVFLGEGIAIDTPKNEGEDIMPADFSGVDIKEGDIVLFRTGWEERANSTRFFEGNWPGFDPSAIDVLIAKKVKAIGGDIASIDSPTNIKNGAISHKKALAHGIPIFEALVNMKYIVSKRFFFIGLPLKIEKGDASPVRAIAINPREK